MGPQKSEGPEGPKVGPNANVAPRFAPRLAWASRNALGPGMYGAGPRLNGGRSAAPLIARTSAAANGPRGGSTLAECGHLSEGPEGPHANVAPVAFRAASATAGNYARLPCCASYRRRGYKGDFERETASIVTGKITLRRC